MILILCEGNEAVKLNGNGEGEDTAIPRSCEGTAYHEAF